MGFIDLYELEQGNPLAIALSGAGRRSEGERQYGDLINVQYKPI
jgi:hypothetical protein